MHYHLAAMHPFLDGNGRTARAVEALLRQHAGTGTHWLISVSSYYDDEKAVHFSALEAVQAGDHDLTPFLKFGLTGIRLEGQRLFDEIEHEIYNDVSRA